MLSYPYRVVDVFTRVPLQGNALAVFPDSQGLDDATMQSIAREFNLSETVFFEDATTDGCIKSLRIFTPAREMMFAGHPTVGSTFVLLEQGLVPEGVDRFQLQEKIGPVNVRVERSDPPMMWLETPTITFETTFERTECAEVLGLGEADLLEVTPQIVSAGNPALFVALKDKEAVDRASLDLARLAHLKKSPADLFFLFIFTPTKDGAYSRMLAPEFGVFEDPATGSATGPLAAYMKHYKMLQNSGLGRFVSEQGTKMGRRSLLYFEISKTDKGDLIEVGGHVSPVMEGTLSLP